MYRSKIQNTKTKAAKHITNIYTTMVNRWYKLRFCLYKTGKFALSSYKFVYVYIQFVFFEGFDT